MKKKPLIRKSVLQRGRDSYRGDIMADWTAELDRAFEKKFGIKCETHWSVIANHFVTTLADGGPLTDEMRFFIDGFGQATLWAANL